MDFRVLSSSLDRNSHEFEFAISLLLIGIINANIIFVYRYTMS
jgi:hypothetical protein